MSDFCDRDLEKFDAAYRAYEPRGILGGTASPSAEARHALHAAVRAVVKARPRCPLELGRKVKVGCVLGIHARIKRGSPQPDPYAVDLYDHFWAELSAIEPWFLARATGYIYSSDECEFGHRGGNFIADPGFIDELLEFAGPAWRAVIAADVMRLNAAAGEGYE